MTAQKEKKYLDVISSCENAFEKWMTDKTQHELLSQNEDADLDLLLSDISMVPSEFKQYAENIKEWNSAKHDCLELLKTSKVNQTRASEFHDLLEKTYFEGMLLLMTFQK